MYSKITSLMERCGEIILSARDIAGDITQKEGYANYVTRYDKMVQDLLIKELKKILPEAQFIAEESDDPTSVQSLLDAGYVFIIDPIDGTTNFIKGLDHSAISVALCYKSQVVFGAIYNPYNHQMYTAQRGGGAYLNGNRITVHNGGLEDGIVNFGTTPYDCEKRIKTMNILKDFINASLDLRRTGSAALDLCDVAYQRSNLFFELQLQPWDYAAGSLIVTEAGGKVTTVENTDLRFDRQCSVLAGTPKAHEQALKIFQSIDK